MDELRNIVKNSNEEEVKSLLFQFLLRINRLEEIEQYSEKQLVMDLKKIYSDFLNYKKSQANIRNSTNYKAVHIVFGDSASGSLKFVLKEMGLQQKEQIISLSDNFSIGPVWQLHNEKGLSHRYNWLKNHIIIDAEFIVNYQAEFNSTVLKIKCIPKNIPIIIWVGENADEQTALRYILYLLNEKTNDIFLMDATKRFKYLFNVPDTECFPLHTGEIISEKLRGIYEKSRKGRLLTQEERKKLEKEWEQLSTKQEVLRIWRNKEVCSVDEAYYDDYIIDTAKKLYNKRKSNEFIKSARLIGEVIGHLNQSIGDAFFEYRVRYLIMNGIFEIEGVPRAMRFYSVKLRQS